MERSPITIEPQQEDEISIQRKIDQLRERADAGGFSNFKPFKRGAFKWSKDGDVNSPDMACIHNAMTGGFVVDDESFYETLDDNLKIIEGKFSNTKTRREILAMSVQSVLFDYFGIFGDGKRRIEIYESLDDWNDELLSIKRFHKEKNTAECLERSAVTQNLNAFLGVDSFMLAGSCDIAEHRKGESHAFNIIKDDDGYAIFDSTNPFWTRKDGQIVKASPALYSISRNDLDRLLRGEGVSVEHVDFILDENDQRQNGEKTIRVYRTMNLAGVEVAI